MTIFKIRWFRMCWINTDLDGYIFLKIIYQKPEIDYLRFFNETLNEYNVSLLGKEIIDGRNTFLLEAEPKGNEGDDQEILIDRMKIWVDDETWIPLKYESMQVHRK